MWFCIPLLLEICRSCCYILSDKLAGEILLAIGEIITNRDTASRFCSVAGWYSVQYSTSAIYRVANIDEL